MKTVNILDFFKALLMCQSVISSIFGQMLLLIFSLPHPFSDHPWFLLSCNKSEKNISMKISKITYDQMSRKLHLHRRCFYKIVIMHRFHIMAITVILYLLESGLSMFLTNAYIDKNGRQLNMWGYWKDLEDSNIRNNRYIFFFIVTVF